MRPIAVVSLDFGIFETFCSLISFVFPIAFDLVKARD